MQIRLMRTEDCAFVRAIDPHATDESCARRVAAGSGYLLWEDGVPVGLMHHTLLWDSVPFLNLLYVTEPYRRRGCGRQAMAQWEREMKKQGFRKALVSTQVDEDAQHFYRRLGYADCGGLLLPGQAMEMFMIKNLEQEDET